MSASKRRPAPELPLDLVDAAGLFGAFAGTLSIALPYFVGLTGALAATLLGVGAIRAAQGPFRGPGHPSERRWFVLGFTAALLGWAFLFLSGGPFALARPTVLGAAGLPLWWAARRAAPFGGR